MGELLLGILCTDPDGWIRQGHAYKGFETHHTSARWTGLHGSSNRTALHTRHKPFSRCITHCLQPSVVSGIVTTAYEVWKRRGMIYEYLRFDKTSGQHLRHAQTLERMTKGDRKDRISSPPLPPHPPTRRRRFALSFPLQHLIFTPRNRKILPPRNYFPASFSPPHRLSANISRRHSRRVRAERLTFQIQSSSDPAKPRLRKPNRIRREGYSQARSRDTALRLCGRPGVRNQRSGPTRRTRPRTPSRYQEILCRIPVVSSPGMPNPLPASKHGQNMAYHLRTPVVVPSCATLPPTRSRT